jgi:hypothetical protein
MLQLLLLLVFDWRRNSPAPRVTEAESNIRSFLEKRLDYKQRTQIWIQVSQQ